MRLLKRLSPLKILLISSVLLTASCKHPVPPVWNGRLYAGDSQKGAIVRAQSNEEISCVSSSFDDYLCMSYGDYKSFIKIYVDGCQAWDKDVKEYQRKLEECGLMTKENVDAVKECLKK